MREHRQINEEEFDIMLKKSLSDTPPKSVVSEVTPWKNSMNRILIGLVLSTVTIDLWKLNYILPAIGTVLTLLGFRVLRDSNKHFKACFAFSVAQAACRYQLMILDTVLSDDGGVISKIGFVLIVLSAALMLAEMFCFWRALLAVKSETNLPKKATPAFILLVCYALVCVLAVLNADIPILVIALFILYFVSVFSVYRLSKSLDNAGYAVKPAHIRLSDRWVVLIIALILSAGFALGYTFGGGYDMKWEKVDTSTSDGVRKIKDDLENLGFPAEVLNDLTAEEITSLDGALQVEYEVSDKSMAVSDLEKGDLTVTTVAVRVPSEVEKWTVIHHFRWRNGIEFFGTHALQIWPAYQHGDDGWLSDGEMTGRVFYDKDGESFSAPYHRLESKTYTPSGDFFSQMSTDEFAAFSLPKNGENCRGYVAYSIAKDGDSDFFSSWLNYTYQKRTLQYPVKSALEQRLETTDNKVGVFRTEQHQFLYNPNY